MHGRRDKLSLPCSSPGSYSDLTIWSFCLSLAKLRSMARPHSSSAGAMEVLGREQGSRVWAQLAGGLSHWPELLCLTTLWAQARAEPDQLLSTPLWKRGNLLWVGFFRENSALLG